MPAGLAFTNLRIYQRMISTATMPTSPVPIAYLARPMMPQGGAAPRRPQYGAARECADFEVREQPQRRLSDRRNRKDTRNIMILVPLLNPTSVTITAEKSCECRVRGSTAPSGGLGGERPRQRLHGRLHAARARRRPHQVAH